MRAHLETNCTRHLDQVFGLESTGDRREHKRILFFLARSLQGAHDARCTANASNRNERHHEAVRIEIQLLQAAQ